MTEYDDTKYDVTKYDHTKYDHTKYDGQKSCTYRQIEDALRAVAFAPNSRLASIFHQIFGITDIHPQEIFKKWLKSYKAGTLSSIAQYCKITVTRYAEDIAKSNMPACGNSHSLR